MNGNDLDYYALALREDLECPNTGTTLSFLEGAQEELNTLRAQRSAFQGRIIDMWHDGAIDGNTAAMALGLTSTDELYDLIGLQGGAQ